MAVDLATLGDHADAAFQDFGRTLEGAGVEVGNAWQQVMAHKSSLSVAASSAADSINALLDDEAHQFMPADQKAYRIKLAQDVYDSVEKAASRGMSEGIAALRASLEAAAQADLKTGDAAERALVREEIAMAIAAAPKGATVTQTLYGLMRDPKYTAEIASGYGALLLQRAGEDSRNLMRDLVASVPGTTPKAQAARAALKALNATQGHVGGLIRAAKSKVEAASKPRPATGYRPDTIRPRA
jgi:predicted RecA/RadA family phage recombinase